MKIITLVLIFFLYSFLSIAQNSSTKINDKEYEQKINKRIINNAKIGDLIALDEYGNYVLATNSMFEKILGFTTSVPYVTPNKPKSPNGNRVKFKGIISIENGIIIKGDFLCPSSKYPGKVMKCSKNDFPYAVADEDANQQLQIINVKVLGYRRTN